MCQGISVANVVIPEVKNAIKIQKDNIMVVGS